jgi:hypothetical protein
VTVPVEPNLDPSAPPVSSPAGQANDEEEIRQLARVLAPPDTMEMTGHKATIEAVSLGDATTAPSVQVNLNGISIPNVAIAANYAPVVGDTVVLIRQLNSYVAAFKIADVGSKSTETAAGWVAASLNAAHSTQGSSTVMYRRVNDHGAWKMQWKGALAYGGVTSLLASALAADFRPSTNRQVAVSRSVSGTLPAARMDCNTDGTFTFFGLSLSSGSSSPGTNSADTASTVAHNHGGAVSTSTITHDDGFHSHTVNSHTHTIASDPPWISLDGVEYFL